MHLQLGLCMDYIMVIVWMIVYGLEILPAGMR